MTLTEYYNQDPPRKGVTVELDPSECTTIFSVHGGSLVGAHICGRYYQYFIPRGSRRLWTMDSHGNKKDRTVFTLKNK